MSDYNSDFLIVGSGIAGLSAAARLSKIGTVSLLSKKNIAESNTLYAQGGIAAAMGSGDTVELHIKDTLFAGAGLCETAAVEEIISKGPACIQELLALGAKFSDQESGPDLGLEGGHRKRRIFHSGDSTGEEIEKTLLHSLPKRAAVFENHTAIDLILKYPARDTFAPNNACYGVYALDEKNGEVKSFTAKFTVLASGGAGKVYRYTSNPDVATGDGMAMAFRAGVALKNMEFVQFHPTCLYHREVKSFLISEALRGEGGILRLSDGTDFMPKYSDMAGLAPRDIVARAIDAELKKSGEPCVFLDMTGLPSKFLKKRFPKIYQTCLECGIDITEKPIPVVPAAHFFCGGILAATDGKTAMPGLYAIGETACTGLHGANRLASNSLLEAFAMAGNAFESIKSALKNTAAPPLSVDEWNTGSATQSDEAVVIAQNWDEIRTLMWNYVGIIRSDKRLERAKKRIALISEEIRQYYWDFVLTRDLIELRNIACLAEQIVRCASYRRESRGLHYNIDCPKPSAQWQKPTIIDRYINELH